MNSSNPNNRWECGVPIIGKEFEWATGLWPINGCAFGPDGSLYVSELITAQDFSGGDVVKIPFNSPGTHISLTGETLPIPAGSRRPEMAPSTPLA